MSEKATPRKRKVYRVKMAFGSYIKGQLITDMNAMWAQQLCAKGVIEEDKPILPAAVAMSAPAPQLAEAPVSRQIKGYHDRSK